MNQHWLTKEKDMISANQIIEAHAAQDTALTTLSLFELIVNKREKRLNFRLSNWVVSIADHFLSLYGAEQGNFVTRKVISHYLIQDHTLH